MHVTNNVKFWSVPCFCLGQLSKARLLSSRVKVVNIFSNSKLLALLRCALTLYSFSYKFSCIWHLVSHVRAFTVYCPCGHVLTFYCILPLRSRVQTFSQQIYKVPELVAVPCKFERNCSIL